MERLTREELQEVVDFANGNKAFLNHRITVSKLAHHIAKLHQRETQHLPRQK